MGSYQEVNMATRKEIDQMLAQIKWATGEFEDADRIINDAREVMRDAAALIDAMAVELAERAES